MKSIAKTIRNPQKFIYKQFYSTLSGDKKGAKMNLELHEIPTEDEIEFEVRMIKFAKAQSPIVMQFTF